MSLILPLDAAYTIFSGIYMTGAAVLRIFHSQMTIEQYVSIYYVFMTFPLLHSAITLFIYICFVKRINEKRILKIQPLDSSGQLYFGQLRKQWNTK
uniref:Uncharacterized protein n=1 Tax=Meloidogyne hapla TaxID=6305 RepID=A0A1I8BBY4_MELHA